MKARVIVPFASVRCRDGGGAQLSQHVVPVGGFPKFMVVEPPHVNEWLDVLVGNPVIVTTTVYVPAVPMLIATQPATVVPEPITVDPLLTVTVAPSTFVPHRATHIFVLHAAAEQQHGCPTPPSEKALTCAINCHNQRQ